MKEYTASPLLGEDVIGSRTTPLIVVPREETPLKRTPNSDTRTIGAASEKLHVEENLDSGYSSVRDKLKHHRTSSSINRELLAGEHSGCVIKFVVRIFQKYFQKTYFNHHIPNSHTQVT